MRNCKGYVYLEIIAAFSICIFVVLSILPILEELMTHRKNIVIRTEAHHLLYERLTAFIDGEIQAVGQDIIYRRKSYELIWRDHGDFPGMIEGCVCYEDESGKYESICDAAKK
ncbi:MULTISPECIES: hypothetical protein [Peribacillus]|uniref:hypothetical protein n=1 Tax=Peribacillus TaxID=2675229 RepID=UPI000B75387D|nr:hypothetical protein [Peribacillus simplex]MDF9760594.1 hypothetical protein [Peribacillus simplex]SNS57835.1 hypothetical protein SAMN05444672_101140 [Bacillus sp. OK838]